VENAKINEPWKHLHILRVNPSVVVMIFNWMPGVGPTGAADFGIHSNLTLDRLTAKNSLFQAQQ
jgi:hypothetical protein